MLNTLKSAWKAKDLRDKITFTILMFLVFRLGAHIPVPGVDTAAFKDLLAEGTIFGFFDI